MKIPTKVRLFIDHITFGFGTHFLLEVLLLQFASVFVTFQFSRSLLIEVTNTSLFVWTYSVSSIVFLLILFTFVSKMGKRTLSPSLHKWTHIPISAVGYLAGSGIVILFGYILLIIATAGNRQITQLDWIFSTMLTTLFAALLAVGYHSRVVDDLPTNNEIQRQVREWDESISWVYEDDRENRKQDAFRDFNSKMDELSALLSRAKTVEGRELNERFESWRTDFETHNPLSKETVIKGQGDNKNRQLEREHLELEALRQELRTMTENMND